MPYRRLADFLTALDDAGELLRIRDEVDPHLELGEVVEQLCGGHGNPPAVLFENVRGSGWPVAANLLGTGARLTRALGAADFDDAARRLCAQVLPDLPSGWAESLKMLPRLAELGGAAPRLVKTAPCQQVVQMGTDVDLRTLPIPQFREGESAPVVTAGQVLLKTAEGRLSAGRPRLQPAGPRSLLVHWHVQHEACSVLDESRRRQQQLPVAIVLGGDPLLTYVAGAPLPHGVDPLWFAGLLARDGLEFVRARTVELDVPAEAELVIEGYVDVSAPAEGRGVVATSRNRLVANEGLPTIHITALTHRANPVFPVVAPTSAVSEEQQFVKLSERLMLPFLRLYLPELTDVHLPLASGGGRLLFARIRKQFPRQARQVIDALCSVRAFLPVKLAVVVDDDVDVQDEPRVWRAVAEHVDPQADTWISPSSGDFEDPAFAIRGSGSRLGIDATRKLPSERPQPSAVRHADNRAELRQRVAVRLQELGLTAARIAVTSEPGG